MRTIHSFILSVVLLTLASILNDKAVVHAQEKEEPDQKSRKPVAGQKPNVLFIVVDDLRVELGCYGFDHVKSPNIDRLAMEGMMFSNAFVQQAVCAASRASFLTGCRPDTTGADYPYSDHFKNVFLKTHPSLPRYFFENGYYTAAMGKIHHGPPFDLNGLSEPYPKTKGWYKLPENIQKLVKKEKTPPYECADVADNAYDDGQIAEHAVTSIRNAAQQDKPFFLAVGFKKPHLPFNAPKKYWDMYKREEVKLAPFRTKPKNAPDWALATYELPQYDSPYKDKEPLPDDYARTLRHAYLACISYVDAQIGKLMQELEAQGLRENTVIVLISDHGWHLGDQGAWGKHMNFEWATHAPLIVSAPGMKNRGVKCDRLIEYVDVFPTICELSGVTAPGYLEGTSMVPLLHDPEREWKKAVFFQYPRWGKMEGFGIRTEQYRYVLWAQTVDIDKEGWWKGSKGNVKAQELYDLVQDPNESVSRTWEKDTMQELNAMLKAGWRAALPPGVVNTSDNPMAPNVTYSPYGR